MITEGIIIAFVTGALAVVGEIIVSAKNTRDLYSKLDTQSQLADERLKGDLAVIHTEINELRKTVEKHNSVIERTYKLETDVARHEERIKALTQKE